MTQILSEQAARALSPELREKFGIGLDGWIRRHLFGALLDQDFATCMGLALELKIGIQTWDSFLEVYKLERYAKQELYEDHNNSRQAAACVAICRAIVAMKEGV